MLYSVKLLLDHFLPFSKLSTLDWAYDSYSLPKKTGFWPSAKGVTAGSGPQSCFFAAFFTAQRRYVDNNSFILICDITLSFKMISQQPVGYVYR